MVQGEMENNFLGIRYCNYLAQIYVLQYKIL